MAASVPNSAANTVSPGINTARQLCRNPNTTRTTSTTPNTSVCSVSARAARIVALRSPPKVSRTSCGSAARKAGSAALTRSVVATMLAPACL